jgi:hypothetical protein
MLLNGGASSQCKKRREDVACIVLSTFACLCATCHSKRTEGATAKQIPRSGVPRPARGVKHAPCNSDPIGCANGEDLRPAFSLGW